MSSLSQGIHNAICIGIIYIGTQPSIYKGLPKVTLIWEVYENDNSKLFSRDYTYSYHEKAILRLHLESWRGRPFTKDELAKFKLRNILGVPCKLEIKKNSKNYKQVENVFRFPANEQAPQRKSGLIYFDIADETTYSFIPSIPPYIVEKIKNSPEYKSSRLCKINE
ncbi:MAG: hypothetical protein J6A69_11275 [Clostridia bacterium]|nr:hypothetical protein [Clostridia bacterium]